MEEKMRKDGATIKNEKKGTKRPDSLVVYI